MSRKNVLNLQGGLGNQLFQYFAALDLTLRTNSKLVIDTTFVKKGIKGVKVDLQDFHLPLENLLSWKSRPKIIFDLKRIWVRMTKISRLLDFVDRRVFRNFRSKTVGWDHEFQNLTGGIRLTGYFQTFKHVYDLSSRNILPALRLKNPSNVYLDYEFQAQKENPIVIHIRRGDYVHFSEFYGLLSNDYYVSALNYLRGFTEYHSSNLWIFTDDTTVAKQMLSHFSDRLVRVIDVERRLSPAETLLLMSKGSAIVCANSTFSFWSAMLSSPSTKKIVPGTWYQNSPDPLDLVPKAWVAIPSQWV